MAVDWTCCCAGLFACAYAFLKKPDERSWKGKKADVVKEVGEALYESCRSNAGSDSLPPPPPSPSPQCDRVLRLIEDGTKKAMVAASRLTPEVTALEARMDAAETLDLGFAVLKTVPLGQESKIEFLGICGHWIALTGIPLVGELKQVADAKAKKKLAMDKLDDIAESNLFLWMYADAGGVVHKFARFNGFRWSGELTYSGIVLDMYKESEKDAEAKRPIRIKHFKVQRIRTNLGFGTVEHDVNVRNGPNLERTFSNAEEASEQLRRDLSWCGNTLHEELRNAIKAQQKAEKDVDDVRKTLKEAAGVFDGSEIVHRERQT